MLPTKTERVSYLQLFEPTEILADPQAWECNQQPHTLSVVERNCCGYRYWGYYGLNLGRGVGLAYSNNLVHWTKYEGNPLWWNARWISVIADADPTYRDRLYFAITRDYDTDCSHIVLAYSDDGIQLEQIKILVEKHSAQRSRNQNPNLFRDPFSGKLVLTFYSGNDQNYFDIIHKVADRILDLDKAPEEVLLHDRETIAAPNMLYVSNGLGSGRGIYYLATEIWPERGAGPPQKEWQVMVFYSDKIDGKYTPVVNNPVQKGQRACLFQHIFSGRYYGYQSHLNPSTGKWTMELVQASS